MIRKILTGVLILTLAGSCDKMQVYEHAMVMQPAATFKDDHIDIVDVKLDQPASGGVRFRFKTRYEVDVQKIEVLSGKTRNNLCTFFEAEISSDSHAFKSYEAIDATAPKQVNYYMVRYFTNSGDWAFSPIYQINVQ